MSNFFEGRRQDLDILSIDEDSELQRLISPRTNPGVSLEDRLKLIPRPIKGGVGLVVEELCPGGLDPTEGILIAQALEQYGAKFIVASGGTKDFPALKYRRETKMKNEQEAEWREEHEAWMSAPLWLIGRVNIPVYACGPVQNWESAKRLAIKLGFQGLIKSRMDLCDPE